MLHTGACNSVKAKCISISETHTLLPKILLGNNSFTGPLKQSDQVRIGVRYIQKLFTDTHQASPSWLAKV
jgi:hypothetical protein